MSDFPFTIGEFYNRRQDIHGRFKGQERGGIITPASHPYVFLITGDSGHQHGYRDKWEEDGTFSYFGEGQLGDMLYIKGNRAIRDHENNGKSLHLFIQHKSRKGWLEYAGELRYLDSTFTQAPDRKGNVRKAIVFKLEPVRAASTAAGRR